MKNQLNKLISEYRSLQPLREDCQKELDKKFRLEFNFNSNHLEGNTLTYGETKLLLLFDQTKGNHELREFEEMKAHDVALLMIKQEAADKGRPLTERFIKDLNQTILVRPFWKDAITSDGQSTRRMIKVGEYKEHPNSVIQANGEMFEYRSPQDTPILMAELVKWYNDESEKGEFSAIDLAALLHYRYIRIHPFDDGNGRVARLLVNYVLYSSDLPPAIIKATEKKEYLRALQQADTGDLQAFINYMTEQLAWSIDLSIRAAKGENIEEQDDWEKQLSLLKKGLGDKSNEVVKKSEDVLIGLYNNFLKPLLLIYKEKLGAFDSMFMSSIYAIEGDKGLIAVENDMLTALEWLKPMLSQNNIIQNTAHLHFTSTFSNLRNSNSLITIKNLSIDIYFGDNAFRIESGRTHLTRLYSDLLSQDEMNTIISDIGKDLMQKIEKAIAEQPCKK